MSRPMVDFNGVAWRKAIASNASGACVEVAYKDGVYGMRDSKDPDGPVLRFTPDEWRAFLSGARAGEFDALGD